MKNENDLSNFNNFCLKYQKLVSSSPISQMFLSEKLCRPNEQLTPLLQTCVESSIEIIPAILEVVKASSPVMCAYIKPSQVLELKVFVVDVYNDEHSIEKLNDALFMDDEKWFDLAHIHKHFKSSFGEEKYKYLSNWVADFGVPKTIALLQSNLAYVKFIRDEELKKECAKSLYKDILSLSKELKYEEKIIKDWQKMGFSKNELNGICNSLSEGGFLQMEDPQTYYSIKISFINIQKDLKKKNQLKNDFPTIKTYIMEVYRAFMKYRESESCHFFIRNPNDNLVEVNEVSVMSNDKKTIDKFVEFVEVAFNENFYEKKMRVEFLNDLFDKYNKSYNLNKLLVKEQDGTILSGRKKI